MKVSEFIGWTAAGAAGLGAVALVLVGQQAIHYRQLDSEHRACVAALQPNNIIDPGRLCDPAISNDHAAAVMAKTCDQALDAIPENTGALRLVCSTSVKTLAAERDVARTERDGLQRDITTLKAGQAEAIRRAEARVQTEAQRKANAVAALASAPRDADGLVVCAADCLRRRAGS